MNLQIDYFVLLWDINRHFLEQMRKESNAQLHRFTVMGPTRKEQNVALLEIWLQLFGPYSLDATFLRGYIKTKEKPELTIAAQPKRSEKISKLINPFVQCSWSRTIFRNFRLRRSFTSKSA